MRLRGIAKVTLLLLISIYCLTERNWFGALGFGYAAFLMLLIVWGYAEGVKIREYIKELERRRGSL